jgi:glycosyltransferase involved in cell wall biosynthesis
MTKSLHVVSSTARRGAETFAVDLVARLREKSEDATVVALTACGRPRPHRIPVLGPSRRSIRLLLELRRRAQACDIVVAHGSSTLEACVVALAGTSTPFVYRSIGDPVYWAQGRRRRRALAVLHRQAAGHVVLWGGAARSLTDLYGIGVEKIRVIPNAVDERRFPMASDELRRRARSQLGIEASGPCFAFVGALSDEKDPHRALHVASTVRDATLIVAGDGPLRASLETVSAGRVPERVIFLGAVEDPYLVYAAADALLLPSRTEGMPAVLIEAGLVGTPTFATAVGAIPEMIEDGRTGFFLHGGDIGWASALADQTTRLRQAGKCAAEEFRNKFEMSSVARAWTAALDEVSSMVRERKR